MKPARLILYLASFLSFSCAQAQDSFSIKNLVYPDTAALGSSDTAIITVRYIGTAQYNGPVRVFFSTSSNSTPAPLDSAPSAVLNPNDTIVITAPLVFDSAHFVTGDGIVVVWSSGNAIMAADSISHQLHVTAPATGVPGTEEDLFFSVHPSPAHDHIAIKLPEQVQCERVRILDIDGRSVGSVPAPKNKTILPVDISHLKNGVYFIEVTSGRRLCTGKFIKAE